jgi:hypothetical protein
MAHWNFWEWLAYSCVAVTAIILAADTGLRMAPDLKKRFAPLLESPWWGFTPLVAMTVGAILFLLREANVTLPNLPPPPWWVNMPLLGAVLCLIWWDLKRRRRRKQSSTPIAVPAIQGAPLPTSLPNFSVPIVDMNCYTRLDGATPRVTFRCSIFNGTDTSVNILGAEGFVRIQGEELHEEIFLLTEQEQRPPNGGVPMNARTFCRIALAVPLNAITIQYMTRVLKDESLVIGFDAKITGRTAVGVEFAIRLPESVRFNTQTAQASDGFMFQMIGTQKNQYPRMFP